MCTQPSFNNLHLTISFYLSFSTYAKSVLKEKEYERV